MRYPRRVNVPDELWRRLLQQSISRIDVLVYAGLLLVEQDLRWIATLPDKAQAGVKVTILLGDPDAEEIARRSVDESTVGVMEAKIRQVERYYARIANLDGVNIQYHNTILYNSIYRFDDEMLVNSHVFGLPAPHARDAPSTALGWRLLRPIRRELRARHATVAALQPPVGSAYGPHRLLP